MMNFLELPDTISIFPLSGAVVLPRAQLPLHIFEPRYLAMVDDALKTSERLIGMIQTFEAPDGKNALHQIGCAGRIKSFSETDDGRYMITLHGISRFRVVNEIDGFTPYRRCKVVWDGFDRDKGGPEHDREFDKDGFLKILSRYFEDKELKTDWENLTEADDELLINSLSMLCPFSNEDKQALLEAPSLSTRRETLVTLMEFACRGGHTDERPQ